MPNTHTPLYFVLTVLVATLLGTGSARAGTFNVYSCQTPAGLTAPTDGWTAEVNQYGFDFDDPKGVVTHNGCAQAPRYGIGVQTNYNVRPGYQASQHYTTGPDLSLKRLTMWRVRSASHNGLESDQAHWAGWISVKSRARVDAIDSTDCGSSWSCRSVAGADGDTLNAADKLVSPELTDVHDLYVSWACVGLNPQEVCNVNGSRDEITGEALVGGLVRYEVKAVQAEVLDGENPIVADATGSLAAPGVHAGVAELTFDATDKGSGLYHTIVEYKAPSSPNWKTALRQVVDGNGGKCAELDYLSEDDHEFGFRVPCKLAATETVAFDTTKLVDGDYDLRVTVEDAAGNTSVVLDPRRFTVDNIPAPSATTLPAINGAPQLGTLMQATNGNWLGNGITFAKQWLRCTDADVASCKPIPNATSDNYRLASADLGRRLRVQVTASNIEGTTSALSDQAGPGVNENGVLPECADGIDNDGDGKIDDADDECSSRSDNSELKPNSGTQSPANGANGSNGADGGNGGNGTNGANGSGGGNGADGAGVSHFVLAFSGAKSRRIGFGKASSTTVSLLDDQGRAIRGAQIVVLQKMAAAGRKFTVARAPLTTDGNGKVKFKISAGYSRTLRFAYAPTANAASIVADMKIVVPSRTTLRTNKKFLHNGQTLKFLGSVVSRPVPPGASASTCRRRSVAVGRPSTRSAPTAPAAGTRSTASVPRSASSTTRSGLASAGTARSPTARAAPRRSGSPSRAEASAPSPPPHGRASGPAAHRSGAGGRCIRRRDRHSGPAARRLQHGLARLPRPGRPAT